MPQRPRSSHRLPQSRLPSRLALPVLHLALQLRQPAPPMQKHEALGGPGLPGALGEWIGKESQQFMSRVGKMYASARDKLKREEEIFVDYCRTMLLGKDHARVVSLIERQEYRSLTSQLLSASLSKITEATTAHTFHPFTQSEMRRIDERIRSLTE